MSMNELVALYARADCCLVTPLVDGMNLVAKEFVVAKDKSNPSVVPGTVVLSEFAGAAHELFDALVVNPYDEEAVARTIADGLEMTAEDRWQVTTSMRESIIQNDSVKWAKNMIAEVKKPPPRAEVPRPAASVTPLTDNLAEAFRRKAPGRKALFLDYDGTLQEFTP